jgi:hypothetical protein
VVHLVGSLPYLPENCVGCIGVIRNTFLGVVLNGRLQISKMSSYLNPIVWAAYLSISLSNRVEFALQPIERTVFNILNHRNETECSTFVILLGDRNIIKFSFGRWLQKYVRVWQTSVNQEMGFKQIGNVFFQKSVLLKILRVLGMHTDSEFIICLYYKVVIIFTLLLLF